MFIELTKISEFMSPVETKPFYVRADLIDSIEQDPNHSVIVVRGKTSYVTETAEQILELLSCEEEDWDDCEECEHEDIN